jgi:hypothetical protein
MSVLDRPFYQLAAGAVLTSHQYLDDVPVEAAVLAAKHYWALRASAPEPPEVLEDTKDVPPVPQISSYSLRRWPLAEIVLLLWVGSELVRRLFKRSKSAAISKD